MAFLNLSQQLCNKYGRRSPRSVVANVPSYDIAVGKFDLQSHFYIHFQINTLGKCINPIISVGLAKVGSIT